MSYPRASHHPEGYWEKPCFSVRLRSGWSGGSPPLFVEKKSIMDEELIPHFSGQGHPKLRLGPSSAEDGKSSEIWYQTPPETFQHQTLAILFFD